MKKTHKISAGLILATMVALPIVGPKIRTGEQAYYFDLHDKTIMVPRCDKTDNRDGCANNIMDALIKWGVHK